MADQLWVSLISMIGVVCTSVVAVVGGLFGARLHSRIGAVESTLTERLAGFTKHINDEGRDRRESIAQVEREQVEIKAIMQTSMSLEREARKELESRMERERRESEQRIISAIKEANDRQQEQIRTLFEKQDGTTGAVNNLAIKVSRLEGSLHPAAEKEA